jgi:hypothetical protein
MWMTVGEFFREKEMDFPMESFKQRLRAMKPEYLAWSRPRKYRVEDLERAYQYLSEHSLIMRQQIK